MLGFALVPDAGHETEPKDWERLDALVAQFAAAMARDGGMSSDAQFLLDVRSDTICLALKGFVTKPKGRAGHPLPASLVDVPGDEKAAEPEAFPELQRRIEAVASTPEPDVHQNGIGLLSLGKAKGIRCVVGNTDNLETCRGELALEVELDENLVHHDENSPRRGIGALVTRPERLRRNAVPMRWTRAQIARCWPHWRLLQGSGT